MLQELIDTFEELKKYIYIVDRGDLPPLIIEFKNENFYHLIGLHKINLDMFFPSKMHSKDKRYKHNQKNVAKYDNIIINQIKGKYSLELRIKTFPHILDILKNGEGIYLYNIKGKTPGSIYNGDYGLAATFDGINCLLGIKEDQLLDNIIYVPQSWMSSNRPNKLIFGKKPMYFKEIIIIEKELYEKAICN